MAQIIEQNANIHVEESPATSDRTAASNDITGASLSAEPAALGDADLPDIVDLVIAMGKMPEEGLRGHFYINTR